VLVIGRLWPPESRAQKAGENGDVAENVARMLKLLVHSERMWRKFPCGKSVVMMTKEAVQMEWPWMGWECRASRQWSQRSRGRAEAG
jgi:hypothetical protein